MRPNGGWSSSGTQNMQSSTGQYSTHAGDPAQPVQHSVITASSLGFFLRGVVMPLERGSCFSASGTIPTDLTASRSAHIARIILSLVPVARTGFETPSLRNALCGSSSAAANSGDGHSILL